eukprot:3798311-Pleurochrysis_carterae.AAC.2
MSLPRTLERLFAGRLSNSLGCIGPYWLLALLNGAQRPALAMLAGAVPRQMAWQIAPARGVA